MIEITEDLPPVVYGDPIIDELNDILWGLSVPEHSNEIDRLQKVVIALERRAAAL